MRRIRVGICAENGHRIGDLEIRFLSDHRAHITIRAVSEYRNYAEMGLEDGRSHKPNESWEYLRTMAIKGSIPCPAHLKDSS